MVLKCTRACMVEQSAAGEVAGRFFNNHMVIWFQGELVFAWLSSRMQVKSRRGFFIIIWSFGSKVNSCLRG